MKIISMLVLELVVIGVDESVAKHDKQDGDWEWIESVMLKDGVEQANADESADKKVRERVDEDESVNEMNGNLVNAVTTTMKTTVTEKVALAVSRSVSLEITWRSRM